MIKIGPIITIVFGVITILFRKYFTQLIRRNQPKIKQFKGADPTKINKWGNSIIEISLLIGGIFFIIFGILNLFVQFHLNR